jgi:hypothetical protein
LLKSRAATRTEGRHTLECSDKLLLCPDLVGHRPGRDEEELPRTTGGHPDAKIACDRVREAFRQAPPVPVSLVGVGD